MNHVALAIAVLGLGLAATSGAADPLPAGYEVVASVHLSAGQPVRRFQILALARRNEAKADQAPERPLLIFEQKGGRSVLVGRNDQVVLRADEGGQCDPFLDGDAKIATKGRYFTIENGVACGQHWTDYITFRLDDRAGGFVFDNERQEEWELNPSNSPDEEALVRAGPPRVTRSPVGQAVSFAAWRRGRDRD